MEGVNPMKTSAIAKLTLVAGFMLGITAAQAATEAECEAGISEVNTMIGGEQGPTEAEREEARELSQQASDAQGAGNYDECMELVEQAKAAMHSE